MEEERRNEAFIHDQKRSVIGCINGIILNDIFWPYIVIILLQIILQDNYKNLVDTQYYTMNLILMIITNLLVLIVAAFIAKPKFLLDAYNKLKIKDIKPILSCVGIMMAANFVYNLILLLCGVDVAGGNENQSIVVELINNNAVLSFISMVIIAPILEEVTYRYFLYGGIAKYNRKWAIIISGFVFMCVHAVASFTGDVENIFRELILLPPYMFSGMVLAYAYDRSSNLALPTSIHALNNLFSFIVCFL